MRKQRFRAPYAIAQHVVRRERERNNIDTVCKYYDSLCVEARVAAACGKQRQRQRLRCWPICYSTWTTISSANSASPVTWGSCVCPCKRHAPKAFANSLCHVTMNRQKRRTYTNTITCLHTHTDTLLTVSIAVACMSVRHCEIHAKVCALCGLFISSDTYNFFVYIFITLCFWALEVLVVLLARKL